MPAYLHLVLTAALAGLLQARVVLLRRHTGLPSYLLALGLALFLVNWADFLVYVALGWGRPYLGFTWAVLGLAVLGLSLRLKPGAPNRLAALLRRATAGLGAPRRWNLWFLLLATFVLARFVFGLERIDGQVWCNFNFIDTPFHLSVVNSLLASDFPPTDLDLAPFPLKYHFLADFHVAHLSQLGLTPLRALWLMNVVSAAAMVGALWSVFARWLRLPAPWVLLAALIFLFLNTALINVVHYLAFRPPFFNPAAPFDGVLAFPFFNFESILRNLLEPQRGLLFTLPVALLILDAAFGGTGGEPPAPTSATRPDQLWQAFALVCLLPLSHIVAFAVLALSLVPALWVHRTALLARWRWWSPPLALGLLQLAYLFLYGPPASESYSGWNVVSLLPPQELAAFPRVVRRVVFWFFANGDFLFWGALFALLAGRGAAATAGPVRRLLGRWRWYFVVCAGCFLLINFYRYTFDWGDSNKFVFFLNLGLTPVITLGAAQWIGHRWAVRSRVLWWFFLLLCVAPPAYEFYRDMAVHPRGKVLLFLRRSQLAADWLKRSSEPTDIVLTGANNTIHFVTPLAGRPTVAGLYGHSNLYRRRTREELIRRIYEEADFAALPELNARFVCVSRNERRRYRLHSRWRELMVRGRAVAFRAGHPDEFDSVWIFDALELAGGRLAPATAPPATR